MTNQEQYDAICENAYKVSKMLEEFKTLEEKLDKTEKQRNALITALNYINTSIIAIDNCCVYSPEDAEEFYKKSISHMKAVLREGLMLAVDNSEGTIELEVK